MKDVWTVAKTQLLRRVRNYRSIAWTFMVPLAIIGVFAMIFLSSQSLSATLVIVDEDDSGLSNSLTELVDSTSHVELIRASSREEAISLLERGVADAALIIPQGLQNASVEIREDPDAQPIVSFDVYYRGESGEEIDILQILLESLAAGLNDDIMQGYGGPVEVRTHALTKQGWGYRDMIVPVTVLIVMAQASVFYAANVTAYLGENNIRKRLKCTPIEPPSLAVGVVISEGTIAGISASIAAVVGTIVFSVPVSATGFIAVIALVFLGSYIFAFLGVIIGSLSGNQLTSQALSALIVFPMVFFASAYILPAIFPRSLDWIAELLPAGQAAQALKLLFLYEPTYADVGWPIVGLLIWGSVFAIIAYWQERK